MSLRKEKTQQSLIRGAWLKSPNMMTSKPLKNSIWICFIAFNRWSITLNILAPTRDVSSITTSYNCSYWHVSLLKKIHDKFDRFVNVCWTSMFNVECIVWPWIQNAILPIDAISNVLIFVKFDYRFLLYSHNKPWIINFKVKVLPI